MGNSELNHLNINELSKNARCKATLGHYASITLAVVMVSWVSTCVQTHQETWAIFVHQLYLSKDLKI